jgi:hypothetical protein
MVAGWNLSQIILNWAIGGIVGDGGAANIAPVADAGADQKGELKTSLS